MSVGPQASDRHELLPFESRSEKVTDYFYKEATIRSSSITSRPVFEIDHHLLLLEALATGLTVQELSWCTNMEPLQCEFGSLVEHNFMDQVKMTK